MHKVFYEAATVLKVVLLLTLIPHMNRQGRNSYFLDLWHYPDCLVPFQSFSSGFKILQAELKAKRNILLSCSYHYLVQLSNCAFLLHHSLFPLSPPPPPPARQLFMALHLVILPLYCFLSELLSRIRQLAYHQDMIYRICKWHSPCGTALILFDFGKTSHSPLLSSKTY